MLQPAFSFAAGGPHCRDGRHGNPFGPRLPWQGVVPPQAGEPPARDAIREGWIMYARMTLAAGLMLAAACAPVSGHRGLGGDTRGISVSFTGSPRPAAVASSRADRVYAGDALYLDGRFASAPMLVMSEGIETRLAAEDGETVELRLPPARLTRLHTDGRVEHYCADAGLAGATPVPAADVCVGVRHDRATGRVEWIVADVSPADVMVAALAPVGPEAGVRFHEGRRLLVDRQTLVEEIVFDGYADGEIRFVRTLYRDGSAETETFGFAYPPRTGIPIYRIGDQAVEVTAVSAAEIEYRLQPL
jgi:hypothetical protein